MSIVQQRDRIKKTGERQMLNLRVFHKMEVLQEIKNGGPFRENIDEERE